MITQFSLHGRITPELSFEGLTSDDLKTLRFSLFTHDNATEISRYTFEVRKGSIDKVSIGFVFSVPIVLKGHSFCQSIPDNDPLI